MLPSQLPKTSLYPRTPTPTPARRRVSIKPTNHVAGDGGQAHDEPLHQRGQQSSRFRPPLGYLLQALLVFGPHLGSAAQLQPRWLSCILAIGTLVLLRQLLCFRRFADELRHVRQFLASLAALLAVLAVENLGTFAVSATDMHKYGYTPLQDNAKLMLDWAAGCWPAAARAVLGWRVDFVFLLFAFLALCLSVLWDQVPYSGFAMGARFMDTIAWAHALRTLAFMTTVLPNPRLNCYARNFPPVPSDPWQFLRIGLGAKYVSGCNDLVISGHSVVYTAVPLAICTYYRPAGWAGKAGLLTWLAVLKLCIQETYEQTHYSVDMLLGVSITALVWHWRSSLYPASAVWRERGAGEPPDRKPYGLMALVVGVLVVTLVGTRGM